MAQVYLYDEQKNQIGEPLDSITTPLGWILKTLSEMARNQESVDVQIEECFDGKNTYFNVHFVPNILRVNDDTPSHLRH